MSALSRARLEEEKRWAEKPPSRYSLVGEADLLSRHAPTLLGRTGPPCSRSGSSRNAVCRSPSQELERQTRKEVCKRLHQPVSGQELVTAQMPEPLSLNDFPPIFSPRPDSRLSEASHFDYFARRCPRQTPEYRRAMKKTIESQRRVLKDKYRRPLSPGSHSASSSPSPRRQSPSPAPHGDRCKSTTPTPARLSPIPPRCHSAQAMSRSDTAQGISRGQGKYHSNPHGGQSSGLNVAGGIASGGNPDVSEMPPEIARPPRERASKGGTTNPRSRAYKISCES